MKCSCFGLVCECNFARYSMNMPPARTPVLIMLFHVDPMATW